MRNPTPCAPLPACLTAGGALAVDRWMLRGYGRKLFPMVGVEPPFTLGRDVVGEIVALGPLAWNFREGQRVVAATHPTADGAHAEYTVCAETGALQPYPTPHARAAQRGWCAAAATLLPDGVATAHAAALPFAALTAWRALHGLASGAPGQTVLVHACPWLVHVPSRSPASSSLCVHSRAPAAAHRP